LHDLAVLQKVAEQFTGVLAALIRVMYLGTGMGIGIGIGIDQRTLRRAQHEGRFHVVSGAPASALARVTIHRRRHKEPAFLSGNVSDVAVKAFTRLSHRRGFEQQVWWVWCDRPRRTATSRPEPHPPLLARAQAVALHQAARASLGSVQATCTQCLHQTWATVSVAALVKGTFHGIRQNTILAAAKALCFVTMCIKATGRNAQRRAHFAHLTGKIS
jgi:hypothetical protein